VSDQIIMLKQCILDGFQLKFSLKIRNSISIGAGPPKSTLGYALSVKIGQQVRLLCPWAMSKEGT